MSLYQCENCGCCENTALASQGHKPPPQWFDWTGIEHLKGRRLCSACGPTKYSDGKATKDGKWHGVFDRVFLPIGMFRTAKNGNLEHIETGDQDFEKYAVQNGEVRGASRLADEINGGALSYAKRYKEEQAKRREEVGSGATATDGHCALGDDHCNCGGDVPAVRAGCANWIRPNASGKPTPREADGSEQGASSAVGLTNGLCPVASSEKEL